MTLQDTTLQSAPVFPILKPSHRQTGISTLVLLMIALTPARAQVLYEGTQGTLPDAQGWTYGAFAFNTIVKQATDNSVLLDTTSTTQNSAGWSPATALLLDRAAGFALAFTARINAETHNNAHRAGFSVIVLGTDTNGVELAFWTTNIFAQSDAPLFNHAEDTAFSTTNAFVDYALVLAASNYVLHANGTPILAGAARNYTAFNGFPNPYRTPNFIFFGDDTGSAAAAVNVRRIALVRPPTVSSPAPGVITWNGVSNVTYTVQTSSNLVHWTRAGTANSGSGVFWFTNSAAPSSQFLRVAFP